MKFCQKKLVRFNSENIVNIEFRQNPKQFIFYASEHLSQNKNILACFCLETRLKLQLTTDKKSDFRSWNQGRYDAHFEHFWGNLIELKLASVFSRLFTATNRDKQQLYKASWRFACFTTESFLLLLKIILKKHSLIIYPFGSVFSHCKKTSILVNLCLAADARCSLESVSAESLILASVTRRPSVKLQTLMVLSTGSGSGPWAS